MRVIRSFFRHIRDGFRNLFRNGLMNLGVNLHHDLNLDYDWELRPNLDQH